MTDLEKLAKGLSEAPLTHETMVRGEHYNWKNQPERLVYLGFNWSGNGHWHQFRKIDDPRPVWCEVTDAELRYFEVTKDTLREHLKGGEG